MLTRNLLLACQLQNNLQSAQPISCQSRGAMRSPARHVAVPVGVARLRGAVAATITLPPISFQRKFRSTATEAFWLESLQELAQDAHRKQNAEVVGNDRTALAAVGELRRIVGVGEIDRPTGRENGIKVAQCALNFIGD